MVSTRSKAGGARLAPTSTISKPTPSRHPKGKKGVRQAKPKAKDGVGGTAGQKFPDDLMLYNHAGLHVSTASLATDALPGLVIFTYPRANTPGCTTQACALRDALPDLTKFGYAVFGLSYDKPKAQAGWRAKHTFGYSLLCDTMDAGLIKMLGAHKAPKGIKRSVFVVRKGQDGNLVVAMSKIGVSPKDTVPLVMEYVNANPCNKEETQQNNDNMEDKPLQNKEEEEKQPEAKDVGKNIDQPNTSESNDQANSTDPEKKPDVDAAPVNKPHVDPPVPMDATNGN